MAASTLNIFNNHCERVRMANLAQAVNVLQSLVLTSGDSMVLTPTYYVFDLFKVHQDAKLLPIAIQAPDYRFGKDSIPAVNVSASVDSNERVHITLVNLDPVHGVPVRIQVKGDKGEINTSAMSGQVLTSERYTDINTFVRPGQVTIKPFTRFRREGPFVVVEMPPKSVVALETQKMW